MFVLSSSAFADVLPPPKPGPQVVTPNVVDKPKIQTRTCVPAVIGRGEYKGKDVCVEALRCTRVKADDPDRTWTSYSTAACQFDAQHRCPSSADCVADESIPADEIQLITVKETASTAATRCGPPIGVSQPGALPAAPQGAGAARAAANARSQTVVPLSAPAARAQ